MRMILETKLSIRNLIKKNQHLDGLPCKIIRIILKMDKERTQTNGPNDKKTDDNV